MMLVEQQIMLVAEQQEMLAVALLYVALPWPETCAQKPTAPVIRWAEGVQQGGSWVVLSCVQTSNVSPIVGACALVQIPG